MAETEWRKEPSHQGGFVLDAGVHFIAAMRQLLGSDFVTHLSAFSTQNQPHLPPLDTVDACLKTKSGATGTVSISFGTTLKGSEYAVAYEKGSININTDPIGKLTSGKPLEGGAIVTTTVDGKIEETEVHDEGTGVKPEVRAWAEGIVAGKPNARQSPEQALADLEIVSFSNDPSIRIKKLIPARLKRCSRAARMVVLPRLPDFRSRRTIHSLILKATK